MDSGKKRFDPRSIDEKAILDIVARKGTIRPDSPATSASPKPEDTVEEIVPGVAKLRSLPPGKSTLTGRPS